MKSKEIIKKVIERKNGIAKAADMVDAGASKQNIKNYMQTGTFKESVRDIISWLRHKI